MKIKEAAKKLGCTEQFLRLALQDQRFSFGTAVKFKQWSYYICGDALEAYIKGNSIKESEV